MSVRIECFYPNVFCPGSILEAVGPELSLDIPTGRIAIVPGLHVVVRVIP